MEEMAKIANEMDRLKNELKKLTDRYEPLEQKMLGLIEEAERTGDRAIETKNILITIKRKGYEAESVAWKEFYNAYYPKLNKVMREQATELLSTYTKIKKVSSSIAVQYKKDESNLTEDNILTRLYNTIKQYISNIMNRLSSRGKEIDSLIMRFKSSI